jgi:uncharacterized OsmC-like protein
MEAMLSAIAGCMAIDVVDILAKMRKAVREYTVECEGWRRDEVPRRFTRIRLTHRLCGPDLDDQSASRAVELSQTRYCSAMASLDPAIEVENVVLVEGLTSPPGSRPGTGRRRRSGAARPRPAAPGPRPAAGPG